jgi:hypothetical protein
MHQNIGNVVLEHLEQLGENLGLCTLKTHLYSLII